MSLPHLSSWSVYTFGEWELVALMPEDRFGPYCVCHVSTGEPEKTNLSLWEACKWVEMHAQVVHLEALRMIREAHDQWYIERAMARWSLRNAKGPCADTGACGQ
jgi:hypothetical protein